MRILVAEDDIDLNKIIVKNQSRADVVVNILYQTCSDLSITS